MTLSELFDRIAEPVCIAARRSPVNKHGAFHKWDHLHSEYGAKGCSAVVGELAHLAKRSSHIPFSCREYSRFSNTSVAILMELLDSPAEPVCIAAGYSPGKTKTAVFRGRWPLDIFPRSWHQYLSYIRFFKPTYVVAPKCSWNNFIYEKCRTIKSFKLYFFKDSPLV